MNTGVMIILFVLVCAAAFPENRMRNDDSA